MNGKKFWLCLRSPLKGTDKKKELQETKNYHKIKIEICFGRLSRILQIPPVIKI